MKWNELLASADQLKFIQGIEARLRRKKRLGDAGGFSIMILGVAIQLFSEGFDLTPVKNAFLNIYHFGFYLYYSLTGIESAVVYEPVYESIGIGIFLTGIILLFVFRHSRFLIRESEEPFRYTFWIEGFNCVGDVDAVEGNAEVSRRTTRHMRLLQHDLMEKLNQRIQRLSLLNVASPEDSDDEREVGLGAHIHIDGNYAVREKNDSVWMVHVMPRVRIGPTGRPSTLAYPVKFLLKNEEDKKELTADRYNQLLERVYSTVATEVYKQIEGDVREKMKLFPTRYLRAVALFNEAEDYVKSNTVDAYDRAIILYKEALRYFQLAEAKWKTSLLLAPFLWRFRIKFIHMRAKVEIGYAQCLIYRRQLSALSGRNWNPLFEIPKNLEWVIYTLEKQHNLIIPVGRQKLTLKKPGLALTHMERNENRYRSLKAYFGYPGDSWLRRITFRPLQELYQKQTDLRFEAYVVNALAHYYLEANRLARQYLKDAKAAAPKRSETDSLYLLTAAIIEKDLDEQVILFRKASEIAPDFEIAQFLLAQNAEMIFHRQDEIEAERAEAVIRKYEEVLKINPGNIAALTAIGYIYWLVDQLQEAQKVLEEGEETKAMVRQTFTGHLHYGLARISAEAGDFQQCFEHYSEAIMADPGLGVFSMSSIGAYTTITIGNSSAESNPIKASRAVATHYYELIGPAMLARFKKLKDSVEKRITENSKKGKRSQAADETMLKTMKVVHSFVLNDYGNACLNYYLRHGDGAKGQLEQAIEAYSQATAENRQNKTAYFNLHYAYGFREKDGDPERARNCLKRADQLAPTWPVALIASVKAEFRKIQEEISEIVKKKRDRGNKFNIQNGQSVLPSPNNKGQNQGVGVTSFQAVQNGSIAGSAKGMGKKDEDLGSLLAPFYERIEKDVFHEFKRVTSHTKLASLVLDYEGKGVSKLPKSENLKSKLDEFDLNVLEVWGDFLLYNDSESSRRPAMELCSYLQDFYPEHFDYYYLKGSMYYEKGEYKNAVEAFTKAVQHNDTNDEYFNMLGNAYFSLNTELSDTNTFDRTIENYQKAIEINGQYPVYTCNLGRAFGELQQWDKMAEHCRKAVELRKKLREDDYGLDYYYEFMAEAYYRKNRLEEFEEVFEADEDLEERDRAWVLNRIGNLMFESADFDEAIRYYNLALSYDDQYPAYLCNIGQAYGELKDWNSMIDYCEKAVALRQGLHGDEKGLDYYYEFLGEASFFAGRLKEFENKLKADKQLQPKQLGRVQNHIANLWYQQEKFKEAIPYYRKAIRSDDRYPVYACNMGRAYGKLGNWDKMIQHCSEAVEVRKRLKKDDYGLDYYYEYLAEAYYEAEQLTALAMGEDLDGKGQARVYNRIGNLFFEDLDYEGAIPYYQLAIACNSKSPVYRCNIGRAHGELGEWDKMASYCEEAVKIRCDLERDDYDLSYYYEFLAVARYYTDNLKSFDTKLESEARLTGVQKAWIQNRIANLFYEAGSYPEAITYQEKAIASDPLKPIYVCNMGRTYGMLAQWDEMVKHCQKAVVLRKEYKDDEFGLEYYYDFLAEACFRANKLSDFKMNGDLEDTARALIQNRIGNLLFEKGSYEEAIPYYLEAVSLNNAKPVYRCNLGRAYGNIGELEPMLEHCREAVKLRKQQEDDDYDLNYYYEYLADAYFGSKKIEDFEIELVADKELESTSRARLYNHLGNLFYDESNFKEAEQYYGQAQKLDPQTIEYSTNLESVAEMNKPK